MPVKYVKKENNDRVDNSELASSLVIRQVTNIESIFWIASFVRIDAEFKLTLSITSFTRIDDASDTRLDTNVGSMFSSVSFVRIDAASVTRPDAEVKITLSIASFTRLDDMGKLGGAGTLLSRMYSMIKLRWIDVSILRLDDMIVGDVFLVSCR